MGYGLRSAWDNATERALDEALQAACALDIPVVGIFGPTNPVRNGPFRARDRAAIFPTDCYPCYKRTCPSAKCMNAVEAGVVAGLVQEILGNNG